MEPVKQAGAAIRYVLGAIPPRFKVRHKFLLNARYGERMSRPGLLALIIGLAFLAAGPADAKRVALVIGINAYDNLKPEQQLRKAVNDSRAIAGALKDDGFEVLAAEDTTRVALLKTWQRFIDTVKPGDITAIYYAGHGVELNGMNYVLARDVPRPDDGQEVLRESAIRVNSLMERLREQSPQVTIWILDACRDNPYANAKATRSIGTTRGLNREEPPKGTLVMMSAGAGQSALDALSNTDTDPNSVYTRTLLPLLKEPGLEITDLAKRVRSEVETLAASIQFEQRPAFYHELSGNFYLVPADDAKIVAKGGTPGMSEAAQAWTTARTSENPAVLEAYARQFGGTFYASLAQARIDELKKSRGGAAAVATAASPAAPATPFQPSPQASLSGPIVSDKPPTAVESAQAWIAVRNSQDVAALEAFLNRHGKSIYASMGLERLEAAKQQRQVVAALPGSTSNKPQSAVRGQPQQPQSAIPSRPPTASESAQAWVSVKDTTDPELLEAFLQVHGESIYARQARVRIEDLKAGKVAAVAPPSSQPATPGTPTPVVGVFPLARSAPLSAAQERALKPQEKFQECDKCPEMVVVPPGSFKMGSPDSELGHAANEGPQRTVSIAKPFAVGKFAVTFAEWDACVAAGGCNAYSPADEAGRRGRQPVVNVSWVDAKAYVAWLSKATGKSYRLLSEAEREYVARAGTDTPFWFGSAITTKQANYDGSVGYGDSPKGEFRQRTLPVDFFAPNPFGLYQVHGNVFEWTEDCWAPNYAGAPIDGTARERADCGGRTLRGGSMLDAPDALRSAARLGFSPNARAGKIGFRVARSL